jgi:hypothetical protein
MADGGRTTRSRSRSPLRRLNAINANNRATFDWWINNHKLFFNVIRSVTQKNIAYYGSYALNHHLGKEISGISTNKNIYIRGTNKIQLIASDIDAKIIGFSENHCNMAKKIMTAFDTITKSVLRSQIIPDPAYENVINKIIGKTEYSRGNPYTIIASPDLLLTYGTSLQYIIFHSFDFKYNGNDCQIFLTGIHKDKSVQTLSEILFTDETASADKVNLTQDDIKNITQVPYAYYPIQDLSSQFGTKITNLQLNISKDISRIKRIYDTDKSDHEKAEESKFFKDRVQKTKMAVLYTAVRIIFCIEYQINNDTKIEEAAWKGLVDIFNMEPPLLSFIKFAIGDHKYKLFNKYAILLELLDKIRQKKGIPQKNTDIIISLNDKLEHNLKLFKGFQKTHYEQLYNIINLPRSRHSRSSSRSRSPGHETKGGGRRRSRPRRRKGATRKLQR